MGWNMNAITIKGITYSRKTKFTLNGNVNCYSSCDASRVQYVKSGDAWYYGKFTESYSKHEYCISTTRPGEADLFVDASAFPPATYYISYNLNGGSGSFPRQSKTYGGYVNIHNRQPTKEGHIFKGWGTSATTKTPSYYANSRYSGNASITLYAIWEIKTYTVEYNANGGKCTPTSKKFNHGAKLTLPTPTRTGYTFKEWRKNSTTGTKLSTSTVVTSSFTAVAVWEINTYYFTVYANGGELVSGTDVFNTIADYGAVVNVPAVSRIGYTFAGWAVTGKGTLTQSANSYKYTMDTSDVILTAQWTVNEYTVTFDANTNGGEPSKIVGYDYGEYVRTNEEALYVPTKPYCEFVGWYTVPEETEDEPVDLNTLVVGGNLTLYAHFEEKNTMLISAEGDNHPAMAAVHVDDSFIEECEVMIYVDGAWRKAVVQT